MTSFGSFAVTGVAVVPGDANRDGSVDINDLTIVLANFGQASCGWLQGCMDRDPTGTVDVNDLTFVLANFGTKPTGHRPRGLPPCRSLRPRCWLAVPSSALSPLIVGGDHEAVNPKRPNAKGPSGGVALPFAFAQVMAVRGQPACRVAVRSSGRSACPSAPPAPRHGESSADPTEAKQGIAALKWCCWPINFDWLPRAYEEEKDVRRGQRMAAVYQEVTGEDIEARLRGSRD